MLIVLSPSKTLDFNIQPPKTEFTLPVFLPKAEKLVKNLQKYAVNDLQKLMEISQDLASLNATRFAEWKLPFEYGDALPAVMVFKGDVYTGLQIEKFQSDDLTYTQSHLRILSGLYGVLRPLDLILPYRLEMGIPLRTGKFKNLYEYWTQLVTAEIEKALKAQGDNILINLASHEYFKAINTKNSKIRIHTPVFKEYKDGTYKMVSFFAKKARGMMSRFILLNQITNPEDMKHFEEDGYFYNHTLSNPLSPVFTRG